MVEAFPSEAFFLHDPLAAWDSCPVPRENLKMPSPHLGISGGWMRSLDSANAQPALSRERSRVQVLGVSGSHLIFPRAGLILPISGLPQPNTE